MKDTPAPPGREEGQAYTIDRMTPMDAVGKRGYIDNYENPLWRG